MLSRERERLEGSNRLRIIAVIPARMGSSRFPGKPMALIHGMPMIGHCYMRVSLCKDLNGVYVATCDQEIYDYIRSIGGNVVMTADTHERASDRAAEAMIQIEEVTGQRTDILVMVQGDEPMDTPEMISEAISPMLLDESIKVVNLASTIESLEEFQDSNTVKVVVDKHDKAIYFSREAIPSKAKWGGKLPMKKQVCIIPFRRNFLLEFNQLDETLLEKVESIDMLRLLENGEKVHMVTTRYNSIGVDTKAHLLRVEELMSNDPLMHEYLETAV